MGKKNRPNKGKNIIIYKEGWVTYCIKRTPNGMVCPCDRTRSLDEPCVHIERLLRDKGACDITLKFYKKFRKVISDKFNDNNLLSLIDKEIAIMLNENCGFCCMELSNDKRNEGWKMCKKCYKLSHNRCYYKWKGKSNKCMYCNYDPVEEQKKAVEQIDKELHDFPIISNDD